MQNVPEARNIQQYKTMPKILYKVSIDSYFYQTFDQKCLLLIIHLPFPPKNNKMGKNMVRDRGTYRYR